jgi:hypothetical protein
VQGTPASATLAGFSFCRILHRCAPAFVGGCLSPHCLHRFAKVLAASAGANLQALCVFSVSSPMKVIAVFAERCEHGFFISGSRMARMRTRRDRPPI